MIYTSTCNDLKENLVKNIFYLFGVELRFQKLSPVTLTSLWEIENCLGTGFFVTIIFLFFYRYFFFFGRKKMEYVKFFKE